MKRWPVVRHVRYWLLYRQLKPEVEYYARTGYVPFEIARAWAILPQIWSGEM
jgi:hypothetical protein